MIASKLFHTSLFMLCLSSCATKHAAIKSTVAKPVVAKPVVAKPVVAKPVVAKPAAACPSAIGMLSNITLEKDATSEASGVTLAQVKDFFRHSEMANIQTLHDYYDMDSCIARGTAKTRYLSWRWEMKEYGVAILTDVRTEDVYYLVDPRKESSLATD